MRDLGERGAFIPRVALLNLLYDCTIIYLSHPKRYTKLPCEVPATTGFTSIYLNTSYFLKERERERESKTREGRCERARGIEKMRFFARCEVFSKISTYNQSVTFYL